MISLIINNPIFFLPVIKFKSLLSVICREKGKRSAHPSFTEELDQFISSLPLMLKGG